MTKVTARLYCHGLGDCNLLRIDDGASRSFWILIDCGIHTSSKLGRERIDDVVDDIRIQTSRLDVIVMTHEHWDHAGGFLTAAHKFAGFDVGEVWMAWTENTRDEQARGIDKFKSEGLEAMLGASNHLVTAEGPALAAVKAGLDSLLGFNFGLRGEQTRSARLALEKLAPVRYLEPGSMIELPGGVKTYVLAPSRDYASLSDRRDARVMYGLSGSLLSAIDLNSGRMDIEDDPWAPFDRQEGSDLQEPLPKSVKVFYREHYAGKRVDIRNSSDGIDQPSSDQSWRTINTEWAMSSVDLAIQLDHKTNNTSLVLIFDCPSDHEPLGNVLLFPGDAQIGSWLSWPSVTFKDGSTGANLLAKTNFYKVGHHGSSNATLKSTLEAMRRKDFVAFVPTDEVLAKKVGWRDVPSDALIKKLSGSCQQLVRSDQVLTPFVEFAFR